MEEKLNSIPITGKWNEIATRINSNLSKIEGELTRLGLSTYKSKGYFSSEEELKSLFENPKDGDWAIVDGYIYLVENKSWEKTTNEFNVTVELEKYIKENGSANSLTINGIPITDVLDGKLDANGGSADGLLINGDKRLNKEINSKISKILSFDGIIPVGTNITIKDGSIQAEAEEILFAESAKMFVARVEGGYYKGWAFNGDVQIHNHNGTARTDCAYIDSDGSVWFFDGNHLIKYAHRNKNFTSNSRLNNVIKEIYIEGGIDKELYITRLFYKYKKSEEEKNLCLIEIRDQDKNVVCVYGDNIEDADHVPPTIVELKEQNNSGISGYAVIEWDKVETQIAWFSDNEQNAKISPASNKIELCPTIYTYKRLSDFSEFKASTINDIDTIIDDLSDTNIALTEESNRAKKAEKNIEDSVVKHTEQELSQQQREQARNNIRAVGYNGTYGNTVVLNVDGEIYYPEGIATSIKMSNGVDNVEDVLIETKEKVDTFLADADTSAEAIDKLKELQEYIKNDETSASQMLGDIAQNRQDIAKEVTRAKQVEMYLESQKADKTGYYENMSVGVSDNLSGRGESSNAEFAMRPSGGENKSIKDGTARINSIKGNSVIWNQQIDNRVGTKFSEGGWICRTGAQNISIENNVIAWQVVDDNVVRNMICQKIEPMSNDDWYYYEFGYDSPSIGDYGRPVSVYFGSNIGQRDRFGSSELQNNELKGHIKGVVQLKTDYTDIDSIIIKTSNYEECIGKTIYIDNFKFTNLTKMFGKGNEPTTVEEFELLYGNMPDDFNEGTIIDNHTKAIKSIGFNAVNEYGEIVKPPKSSSPTEPKPWIEEGKIYTHILWNGATNTYESCDITRVGNKFTLTSDGGYGVGFCFRVIPQVKYKVNVDIVSNNSYEVVASYYDENKVWIGQYYIRYDNNRFTPPQGCKYVVLVIANTVGGDNLLSFEGISVHLEHTGYLNGKYFPYESQTRELPTVEGGLKSAINAYDEIRYNVSKDKWEYVKRIGSVDLGTLDWRKWNLVGNEVQHLRFCAKMGEKFNGSVDNSRINNIINKRYNSVSMDDTWVYIKGITIAFTNANDRDKEFIIYDDAYTVDDADKLKSDLSGVICYYELEEPIITELDTDISPDYKVWDYGTEEAINSELSTPVKLNLNYGFNAVGQITDNTILIEELLARVAQLEAKITQVNSMSDTNEEE